MNRAAFGDEIDIHGGGRDLIFPHHENEIAQTESLTGKRFAKYWTHNGLIKINGQKMSKSLGNTLLLEDLLKKYTAEAIKFALLQNNYRNDINITDTLFPDAEKHLTEFYKTIDGVETAFGKGEKGNAEIDKKFDADMDEDFNTALALSELYGLFKAVSAKLAAGNKSCADDVKQIRETYSLLGIFRRDAKEYLAEVEKKNPADLPENILKLAEERWQAKKARDFQKADALRAEIDGLGYAVKDSKDGYAVTKK